jgi:transposase
LDVSLKETAISVRQGGKRIWRGKCASDPKVLAAIIRDRAPQAKRVVFETGPLSVWFYHALMAKGIPAICSDARHAKAALDIRTMPTAWRSLPRLVLIGRFGSSHTTAC